MTALEIVLTIVLVLGLTKSSLKWTGKLSVVPCFLVGFTVAQIGQKYIFDDVRDAPVLQDLKHTTCRVGVYPPDDLMLLSYSVLEEDCVVVQSAKQPINVWSDFYDILLYKLNTVNDCQNVELLLSGGQFVVCTIPDILDDNLVETMKEDFEVEVSPYTVCATQNSSSGHLPKGMVECSILGQDDREVPLILDRPHCFQGDNAEWECLCYGDNEMFLDVNNDGQRAVNESLLSGLMLVAVRKYDNGAILLLVGSEYPLFNSNGVHDNRKAYDELLYKYLPRKKYEIRWDIQGNKMPMNARIGVESSVTFENKDYRNIFMATVFGNIPREFVLDEESSVYRLEGDHINYFKVQYESITPGTKMSTDIVLRKVFDWKYSRVVDWSIYSVYGYLSSYVENHETRNHTGIKLDCEPKLIIDKPNI